MKYFFLSLLIVKTVQTLANSLTITSDHTHNHSHLQVFPPRVELSVMTYSLTSQHLTWHMETCPHDKGTGRAVCGQQLFKPSCWVDCLFKDALSAQPLVLIFSLRHQAWTNHKSTREQIRFDEGKIFFYICCSVLFFPHLFFVVVIICSISFLYICCWVFLLFIYLLFIFSFFFVLLFVRLFFSTV